ncbi:glutamate-5-semialdehyde dehydrogenase [Geosporobacter ferrireducens]|uniref:Gamma-glutamyl phosphate reductase n=1 Tax=Geosporobacter ferrireducens TaxID=1424294 RepID=A0A1D8GBE9_9FIRM|nr:glutamate-5-semialdehyde dehydrogenase [Geosporobacter ferrireducens]AOT68203.1 glutamate-5-semialdehyde dehydrogenase [Geosporobacter ferrireducens]MTI54253.1 glutamate-5-semialdehyde dehydrogenase [Geosporobacter ferrireducens]
MSSLIIQCKKLRDAAKVLGIADTKTKNKALANVAKRLRIHQEYIMQENEKDVFNARKAGIKESLIDRLRLDENRIEDMIQGIQKIIDLRDPIWNSDRVWTLENGLTISKMTVPLGVIGIIYESRPNVTIDAFALALKSGNCILLRGSSTSIHSNRALVYAVKEGLKESGLPEEIIGFIDDVDRSVVMEMLTLNEYIDLIIPRGGKELIQFVIENATVPTIETGVGNCHIYIDERANLKKALRIVENAKIQRPGVCNACETILIHEQVASEFLPQLYKQFDGIVDIMGCEKTRGIITVKTAEEQDWMEEYLDYKVAIKVVQNIQEAILHIDRYGTKHSEAIVTESLENANLFLRQIDAAAVYVNASTRFTDGGQFGFGAEMGISTQKIHARGPIGLEELVTSKYTIMGNGQIRE